MENRESTLKTMNMLGAAFQGQLLIGCAIKEFCRSDRQPYIYLAILFIESLYLYPQVQYMNSS